jgi:hypothetical protein
LANPAAPRKPKSRSSTTAGRDGFTFSQERTAILLLYAAKIAAAQLHAPKHELAAILAALRAEQRAALRALRATAQARAKTRRQKRLAWLLRRASLWRPRRRPSPAAVIALGRDSATIITDDHSIMPPQRASLAPSMRARFSAVIRKAGNRRMESRSEIETLTQSNAN